MKRTMFKLIVGGAVTVGTLAFLIPLIDLERMRTAFLAVNLQWAMVGFLVYAAVYMARALRFRILLPGYTASFFSILRITMIHGAAVRILPNPFGELAFIGGTKSLGIRYSSSISALVVCRALDFATIALFLFVGAILLIPSTGLIAFVTALAGGAITVASVSIIAIASFYQGPLLQFFSYLARRFPHRGALIAKKGTMLIDAFRTLREEGVYAHAVASSFLIWFLMFGAYGAFFQAAGNIFSLIVLIVAGAVQILANIAPSIGGIGTMEAGWHAGFTISNTESAAVLAGAIFVDVATLLGTIVFGGVGLFLLWCTKFKFQSLKRFRVKPMRLALFFVIVAGLLVAGIFFHKKLSSSPVEQVRFLETYPEVAVEDAWTAYRTKIQKDGRTIDRDRDYLTTSEGQSYSLLRAVWMDDKETFDQVLKWTNNNLGKRPNDHLFAWLWGKNSDGRWDIIHERDGINTASDADQDIALALIFAGKRWNQDEYIQQAQTILTDIWEKEVAIVNGKPYLVAGNWAAGEVRPTINPSYFSFAAYPIFAEVDPVHPWLLLKDTSYEVLNMSTKNPLDGEMSAGIPPDWISIDYSTGEITRPIHDDKSTHFSDDAFRTLWRVALDWEWHRDPRAHAYLSEMDFFERAWRDQQVISGAYTHDGKPVTPAESNSVYAVIASSFASVQPEFSRELFNAKVAPLYDADTEDFVEGLGYYALNWVWFGMALYTDNTPNLFLVD